MGSDSKPKAPAGLSMAGRRLWRTVVAEYELRVDELVILESACRTADMVDVLHQALVDQPATVKGSEGQIRAHPLLAEIRQQRATLAAMLRQLRLPDLDAPGATGSTEQAANERSIQAREAAMARWRTRGSGA